MKFLVDFLINGPERLSATFAWLPPLLARLVVGWVFMWSGWGKLNGRHDPAQQGPDCHAGERG